MTRSTRLWRRIGARYQHMQEQRSQSPVPGRPHHWFWRLCRVLVGLGFLRVDEGGYYVDDGRWEWRFWRPVTFFPRPDVAVTWNWWTALRRHWPGWRYLLTGRGR